MTDDPPPAPDPAEPVATPFRDLSPTDRRVLLREAAVQAELATGTQETEVATVRRNIVLRIATIVVGFVVLVAGLAMMVLPGPGMVAIIVGLGLLARELVWAERLLEYVKKRARLDELKKQPAWVRVVMWIGTIAAVGASLTYVFFLR